MLGVVVEGFDRVGIGLHLVEEFFDLEAFLLLYKLGNFLRRLGPPDSSLVHRFFNHIFIRVRLLSGWDHERPLW